MTVTQRILLYVAASTAFVVAMATAVAYRTVYSALERRDLGQLEMYIAERAQREEARFAQVQANLKLVRGQFLERLARPSPPDFLANWDHWYRLYPDGAWRSREEFSDARKFSSMWAHKDWRDTPEARREVLIAQELCDDMLEGWVDTFPSYYFQFRGPLNIGVDTAIPDWAWQMPADFPTNGIEWLDLALPATPPPSDRFAWTGLQQDEVVDIQLVCVFLPIYVGGEFIGSVGHNMSMAGTLDEATRSVLHGASHFIFRADGRLIAHATKREDILDSKGLLTAEASGDPVAASIYRIATSRADRRFSGYDSESGVFFSVTRLAGPDWYFATVMPRAHVRAQAYATARWVLWTGVASLALVIAFIAAILRSQVSRPLADLTNATEAMIAGTTVVPAIPLRADELGRLASSFREMNEKVIAREQDLRQLNTELEQRVTERTNELARANRRLADSLRTEKEVSELRANFVSLVSHEFRTPLEIILTSSDILDRYLDRLSEEKRAHHLRTIHESVKRMSGMMEDVMLLGKVEAGKLQFKPEPFDLEKFCHRMTDETLSVTSHRCPVELELAGDLAGARGDESLLRHIVGNLLSNAVKFSPAGAPVTLRVERRGDTAVLTIRDRGRGIPLADRERLFQSFQRGSNVSDTPGTGLGLLIVRKCVEIHGGFITLESEVGEGTTFIVSLPLYRHGGDGT